MLSFIKDTEAGRNFWNTAPSGDYESDFAEGRKLGRELIEAIRARAVTPFMLAETIQHFPAELTPIERGFLTEFGYKALT